MNDWAPSISIASESIIEESENEEWDINTSSCDNTREYYIYIYLIITIYWWTLYSIVYHYLQEYEKCAIGGNFTAYLIGKNQHFKDITNDFKMPLSPK